MKEKPNMICDICHKEINDPMDPPAQTENGIYHESCLEVKKKKL